MIYQGKARYPVHEIVVHCTATRPDFMKGATSQARFEEIRRWHMQDRGWSDIGYHLLIDRGGEVLTGRPFTTIGAHGAGHNAGTIGISLFGGHGSDANDAFIEHFTPQQDQALRRLIEGIETKTQIMKISGHNEYAAKACPGFNVSKWLRGK